MEETKTYTPSPMDTSSVVLTEPLQALVEKMAENVHDIWAESRIAEGWRYGPERSGTEKTNPCLVPYSDLPEHEKEYDRKTATETVKLILSLGFTIDHV